jgi:bifunctional UDP-N-acetylglucosamine pyrophosphorylase/glucosamine-1-phosphate N-acetyltransferase
MICENGSRGAEQVLVLYADHPLVSSDTIRKLASTHESSGATITMATSVVPDFEDWHSTFVSFGRLVRDAEGNLSRIVEAKDANDEERKIREINPGYMCFDSTWLWEHLRMLKNDNTQKEYYLTDLVSMAFVEKKKISLVTINPREALGVNTKEQLELLENLK